MKTSLKKMIITALFLALTCVATLLIRIPTPATGGYVHPGDAFVILCGVILGPGAGFLAAGLGSALADLFGGYVLYAPVTFVIKGLTALITALIFRTFHKKGFKPIAAVILGGAADIILVTGGYFIFELLLYGISAVLSIPANLIQGASGLVLSAVLYPLLIKIPDVRHMVFS